MTLLQLIMGFFQAQQYCLIFLTARHNVAPTTCNNTVAIEVLGRNRIYRINIKAQHSAFSSAISKAVL